jgi:hypothetical protein
LLACALVACTTDTFVSNTNDAAADEAATTGPTCGATRCGADTCCVAIDGGASCHTTCPNQSAALACTSSGDCASGLVCCMHKLTTNNATVATCVAQCGPNDVQLCSLPSDPTCNASEPCSSSNIKDWNLPESFGTCGGRGLP